MAQLTGNPRICSTCKYAPSCALQKDENQSVFTCEHYERDECEPAAVAGGPVAPRPRATSPEQQDAASYRGLCTDCVSRATCALSNPEGGVWHCSEYMQMGV